MPLPPPVLIGTWANSLLYMAEIIEVRYYFTHFKHDDWKLKMLVWAAFLIDTVSVVADYAAAYLVSVHILLHAGDPVYLSNGHWPIPVYLFTTAMIAVLVQSFLVVRYWRFTRNTPVTLLNSFLIFVAFGGSFAAGVVTAMFPALAERQKDTIPATIWLVTEAVADLSIAAALLWQFKKASPTLVKSRSALHRLMALTIQTGTVTAAVATAALITFLLKKETNICVGIAYTLGRLYVLSLLANLNVRRSGRSGSVASSGALSAGGPATLNFPSSMVAGSNRALFPFTLTRKMQCAKNPVGDSSPAETKPSPLGFHALTKLDNPDPASVAPCPRVEPDQCKPVAYSH
ncbi:hypothetical protein B0H19DRAFT_1143411 [Mycena capillaripes]|nr:hypothetical protein B0H19DRAFT_1143411 [Mycena capillaripes]